MSRQEKKRKHINSFQSLNDAIHWSPSTIRELGHPVAPTGGEQVDDACLDFLSCPLLRFAIGPETTAELQHSKLYGFNELFGSAGNPLTHRAIYGSSDPQARELSGTPLPKEFHCIR
ncbi:hypothetical protein TNCV_2909911 [Trichonephila clavipes]|nr:hypothetical protein TNCV_2909911 [Trichonephila clavipes]